MKAKKMPMLAKVLLASILIVFIVFLVWQRMDDNSSVESSHDYEKIELKGVLNVVTDYNSIGYFVSEDSIAGFNHDMLELIQEFTPIRIETSLESNFEKAVNGLLEGKYDVLAYNTPITTDLKNSLSFTESIVQNRQVLVQRKKEYNNGIEPLRGHLDLAKKTLHVAQNSPVILRIQNLSDEIGDTIYYIENKLYNSEQLVLEVAAGDIDYAVCDEQMAQKMAKSVPEIDYTTLIGFTHFEAWAVRNDSPQLLDSLNVWISKVKKGNSYKLIEDKYYK